MKKLFALFTLCLLTIPLAWGADVIFVAGTDMGETSVTKDGVTVTMSTMSRTDNYRCYGSSSMTVSSTVGSITSIELTCTASGTSNYGPSKFSLNMYSIGSYSYSGYTGTWTRNAVNSTTSVTLDASSQVRMTQIVVTIEGQSATVEAPVFSPVAGEVASGTEVSMTTTTAGAAIYYTTNGSTPTSSSTQYAGPVSITAATTFKAIAIKDGVSSEVTTAAYTIASSGGGTENTATLTNADIVAAGPGSGSYSAWRLTDGNGKRWYASTAIKNQYSNATSGYHYLQIKKSTSSSPSYLQVPEYGTKITKLVMTVSNASSPMTGGGNGATLFFSSSGTTTSTGTGVVSATGSSTVTIDCSTLNLNTGYITASGAVRIWDVTVYYEEEAPGAYTISTSVQPAEGGAVTVKRSANEGDDVAFEVAPVVNYELDLESVQVTDASDNAVTCTYGEDGKYHFTMPASNVTISANFSQAGTLYILGQVNGREASQWNPTQGTPMTYLSGKYTARVYVTGLGNENQGNEKEGYGFLAFSKELAPSNDQAGWDAINNHGLRYGSGATGEYWPVSANEANQSHFGDVIPLYQHSQKSYRLPAGVYDIEIDLNSHPNSVKFTPVTLTLTLDPASGTFNVNKQVAITSNLSTLIASINPDETRVAISHKVGDGDYQSGATATLGTAGENITVTGRAALGYIEVTGTGTYTIENKYTIAISTDSHGTVTAKVGDQTVTSAAPGETVALSYSPQSDYQLAEVTVTDDAGNPVTVSDNTFTMPASNVAVAVTFSRIPHGITVSNECVSCTITDYPTTATAGTQVSFTVRPKSSRYSITSVTVTNSNGSTIDVGTPRDNGDGTYTYTFGMQAYDVVLCAVCERQSSSNTFKLVTSQTEIVNGGKYVLIAGESEALHYNGSNFDDVANKSQGAFTISDNIATVTSDVAVLTLEPNEEEGYFNIKTSGSYLDHSGTSKSLVLSSTGQGWELTYNSSTKLVTIQGEDGYYIMDNYSHFRCYNDTDNGTHAALYKQVSAIEDPEILPESGVHGSEVEVEITCATQNAVIYYTTDGTDPVVDETTGACTAGTQYSGKFDVTAPAEVRAIAVLVETDDVETVVTTSEVTSARYNIEALRAVMAPGSGSYVKEQTVTIYTENVVGTPTIYYTTDGTDPKTSETRQTYTEPFVVSQSCTVRGYVIDERDPMFGGNDASVSATYTIGVQAPVFSPVGGIYYQGEQPVEIFSLSEGANIYYTITDDGTEPAAPDKSATRYDGSFTLAVGKVYNIKAIAYVGNTASAVSSVTYDIRTAATGSNILQNVAELNAFTAGNNTPQTFANPVQIVFMSTYQNGGVRPEYAFIRDNSGYGLVYFGKNQTQWTIGNNVASFRDEHGNTYEGAKMGGNMGWWLGRDVAGQISIWKQGGVVMNFHPEMGVSGDESGITSWPGGLLGYAPILPETHSISEIKAGEARVGGDNLWGHYVHMRNNQITLTTADNDGKYSGTFTDEDGNKLALYDVFYRFMDMSPSRFTGKANRRYDIYGVVNWYQKVGWQVMPIDFLWIDIPQFDAAHRQDATYQEPQTVRISSDDDPSATIWYKTSDMEDFEVYNGSPITVDHTMTIETFSSKPAISELVFDAVGNGKDYNDDMKSVHNVVTLTIDMIEKPVISPESNVYAVGADPVQASISCESADATIYYTTDGSDPKTSETRQTYTAQTELSFSTTTTVRAIAERDGYYSAEADSRTYTFVKSNGVEYELVTDHSQLDPTHYYIIVSKEAGEALSTTQGEINRGASGVLFKDNEKTIVYGNSDVATFTLTNVGTAASPRWLLKTANSNVNGYLHVGDGNMLLTEAEPDAEANAEAVININAADGSVAHIQFAYDGATKRYIRYWNRDRVFSTYTNETNLPVYIYGTASTPLAVIEQSGKQGESYTVADDLQVVYACQANGKYTMWARDLVDNINAVEVPATGGDCVDYMHAAGQQTGQWQQNNWVMLDFASVSTTKYNSIADLLAQGKHPVVKGGTLSGQFVDQRNYTIKVNNESSLELDTDVDNYVFNVYCPANYGPNDENGSQQSETQTYWFMTPKVMEVATHTWSVWKASGDDGAFYMPERKFEDGKWFNEANLQGAYDVAWDYNAGSFRPTDGEAYQFLAVTMLKPEQQGEPAGAPRRVGAQPDSQPNATQVVNPLDLNGGDEHVVTAVNRLVADRQVVSVTYCDVAGRMSTKPFKGVNIVVTRYSDGTQQTTKTTIF